MRLAHFRRFWNALGNIANYWDTSCDEYFPEKSDYEVTNENAAQEDIPEEDEKATAEADEPRKRAKPNPEQDSRNKDFDLPLGSPPPSGGPPLGFRPPQVPGEPARPPGTYRGYRVSNGAGMPDSYRIETARAFVEPIAWAFGFTLAGHRRPPLLEIKSLLVPIKLSGTVWRAPNVRDKARAGYLQGPVLGISCRSETGFAEGKADPVLDTLRELGAMLCLAQERAREGNTERKPGEGKWWTSVPRWGGGPGGEMGEAVSVAREDDIEPGSEVIPPMDPETRGRPTGRSNGLKRKQAIANAWKTLRVGVGFWDPRTEYTAVGKPVDSDWDEVCIMHFGILKMMN